MIFHGEVNPMIDIGASGFRGPFLWHTFCQSGGLSAVSRHVHGDDAERYPRMQAISFGLSTGGISSVIRQVVPVTPPIKQTMVDFGVNSITRLALSTKNSVTRVKGPYFLRCGETPKSQNDLLLISETLILEGACVELTSSYSKCPLRSEYCPKANRKNGLL
jgi:hypothetical protein